MMARTYCERLGRQPALGNERGMALILTLSMLAILSILGAFALSTTDTELGVTANFRGGRESFMAAERILEYAKALVVETDPEDTLDLVGDHEANINLASDGLGDLAGQRLGSMDSSENNSISYIADGSGPEAYYGKKDAGDVLGIYFRVSATGQSRSQRSKTRLETTFFAVTKVGSNDDGNYSD